MMELVPFLSKVDLSEFRCSPPPKALEQMDHTDIWKVGGSCYRLQEKEPLDGPVFVKLVQKIAQWIIKCLCDRWGFNLLSIFLPLSYKFVGKSELLRLRRRFSAFKFQELLELLDKVLSSKQNARFWNCTLDVFRYLPDLLTLLIDFLLVLRESHELHKRSFPLAKEIVDSERSGGFWAKNGKLWRIIIFYEPIIWSWELWILRTLILNLIYFVDIYRFNWQFLLFWEFGLFQTDFSILFKIFCDLLFRRIKFINSVNLLWVYGLILALYAKILFGIY